MKAGRIIVGIAISAAFAVATVSRVDIAAVGHALGRAAPLGLAAAFVFAWLEIAVRAWRWRYLLTPLGRVGYRNALAYTCVGYFANTLLPMRLGDVARAYLAATALHLPRLATLGSIATERIADGLTILLVAAGLGLVATDAATLAPVEMWIILAGAVAVAAVAAAVLVARRQETLAAFVPARLRTLLTSLVRGAAAVRSPRGAATTVVSTLVAYLCAVGAMIAVAGSVGLSISPVQAGFAMAWIGLSTAIPAAPGSVGTYEFVGVSVLTILGQDPAASLAAVVLLHVIGTLPVALVGLVTAWALHLRVWRVSGSVSAAQPEGA